MAHELAHIKNRDTLTMTVAATIGGAISMLAQYLQFRILFGGNRDNAAARLDRRRSRCCSRRLPPCSCRWRSAARASIRPTGSAPRSAAIRSGSPPRSTRSSTYARQIANPTAEAAPATAHIFIINPLSGQGMDNLFSTHPNTENRIAELEALAQEMRMTDYRGGPAPSAPARGPSSASGPWSSSPPSGSRGPWG